MKVNQDKRQVNVLLRATARAALNELTTFYDLSQASVIERLLEREANDRSLDILGSRAPKGSRR